MSEPKLIGEILRGMFPIRVANGLSEPVEEAYIKATEYIEEETENNRQK